MKQLILNFISTFVLVFLLCGSPDAFVAARNLSRTLYPPTEADDARPIYFYGFINNEHYKHFMPGSRTISAGKHVLLKCPPGTWVNVTQASFGTPSISSNGQWRAGRCHYSTSLAVARSQCRNKTTCKISPTPEMFAHEERPLQCTDTAELLLAADFTCEPITEPAPLYTHERGYISGVTPHYLFINNKSANCTGDQERNSKEEAKIKQTEVNNLAEAVAACDEDPECSFFVFDEAANAAVRFCSGKGWAHAAPRSGLAVAVKPSEFLTHGFAVYLNYFGICLQSNTLQKAAAVQDVQEGAALCSQNADCSYATFSLSTGLLSLPNFENHIWLCSGTPAMIPLDGAVFAAKAKVQGPETVSANAIFWGAGGVHTPQGYPTPTQVDNRRFGGPPSGPSLSGQIY